MFSNKNIFVSKKFFFVSETLSFLFRKHFVKKSKKIASVLWSWPIRDERSHLFQTLTPLLLLALILLLQLRKILIHQLRLLLTLRKLPSNTYQENSVYFAFDGTHMVGVVTWQAQYRHGWRNLFQSGGTQVHVKKNYSKSCGLNWQLWCHKHWNMTSLHIHHIKV